MSTKSEQNRTEAPKKSRPRPKHKPKFEVPAEVASPAAAWVPKQEARPQPPTVPREPSRQKPTAPLGLGPVLDAGAEAFGFGLATMGRMFLAGARLLLAPLEITGRLLRR